MTPTMKEAITMPRQDRSFTSDDVVRILCNNLSGYEFLKARLRIAFDPCDTITGFCGIVNDLIKLSRVCALADDMGVLGLLDKIPYVKGLSSVISAMGALEPYFELTQEVVCVKGGDDYGKNASSGVGIIREAERLIEDATKRVGAEDTAAKIENVKEIAEDISYFLDQLPDYTEEDVEDYLFIFL